MSFLEKPLKSNLKNPLRFKIIYRLNIFILTHFPQILKQ